MPEKYHREESDRNYGSEVRNRSLIRREESPSERRNHYAGDRDRQDRSDRYRDSHRGYDRRDERRHSYHGYEDHRRHSNREHGIRYDQDRNADDDDRYKRSGRRDCEVEETGSSEMRMRRRRNNLDGRNFHDANRDNSKRERSEECESEPAKRRRSGGDMSPTARRHAEDSHREDNVRSPRGGRRDFNHRTGRHYDHYPHEDTGRSTALNRRYTQHDDDARSDYDRRRDRASGRRTRRDYEDRGDEEQSARPSKRRASDISPPREEGTGRHRSSHSPHEDRMDVTPTRGTRTDDHLDRRQRIASDDARVGNVRNRENFLQGNGARDSYRDAQMAEVHEVRSARPMYSARDDPRSGFRHFERRDQARDDNRRGFGGRNADRAQDEFRGGFGGRERYDHRFRGSRLPEGAHSERRQFNRFDTPRPDRSRHSGGRNRGRFQQRNSYEAEAPTFVWEAPKDEKSVLQEDRSKADSVVFDVWDETTRTDEIPEIYKRIEAEMRENGEITSTDKTETKNETQGKRVIVICKSNTGGDMSVDNVRNGNADEKLEKAQENSDGDPGAKAKGDGKNNGYVDEEMEKSSRRNKDSNADMVTEDDEIKNGNENNREDKICEGGARSGSPNEKMEVTVGSKLNIEEKEDRENEDVE